MPLETGTYIRAPFTVQAVRVTSENIEEVTVWCGGDLRTEQGEKKYIKIRANRPTKVAQTMAFPGDWIVHGSAGFNVFKNKAFWKTFRNQTHVYTEETLIKVFEALVHSGLHGNHARAAITKMQRAGILFREKVSTEDYHNCEAENCYPYESMGVMVHTDDNYGKALAEEDKFELGRAMIDMKALRNSKQD